MSVLARIPCRLVIVALLTASLLVGIALLRPPEGQFSTGLSREKFWLVKLRAKPIHDLVLAGDSRVLCDLDAATIGRALSARVVNFGFNVVALTPEYVNAAASKLDPRSSNPTILFGVTPRALTPLNRRVSGFTEEQNRPWDEKVFNWNLNALNQLFRPISPPVLILKVLGKQTGYKDYFNNGWMPVSLRPPNPTADLGVYERIFVGNRVSSEMQDAFLRKVRQLSDSGIRVLGVRLPISPQILEQEERRSGFDQEAFIRQFEESGGHWIESPVGNFVITDGSHIDAGSARAYSLSLATKIQQVGNEPSQVVRRSPSTSPMR